MPSQTLNEIQIGNPAAAWLLIGVGLAVIALGWGWAKQKRARQQFGTRSTKSTTAKGALPKFIFATLLISSLICLSLALVDFRWGKTTYEVPQKGLEVVFALDVSRSMLAEDTSPNRLERAKQQIKDMLDEMAGDRVGLVIFAGEAEQAVPLTRHYEDFKQVLDSVSPDSIPVGGSQLGVAIEVAANSFLSKTSDHKTIVLFTDGEDQESQPIEVARKLHKETGLRVFTVGLGDFETGARIPDSESQFQSFVQHQGKQVWSKLNGRTLKEIATESNAAYIPAGTKQVNMGQVYLQYVGNVKDTEFEKATIDAYTPRFQWFAYPALLCLLLEVWLSRGKTHTPRRRIQDSPGEFRRGEANSAGNQPSHSGKTSAAAILLILLGGSSTFAQTNTLERQINQANALVKQDKFTEAIDAFEKIDASDLEPTRLDQLNYNLAVAHYRNADYSAAAPLFQELAKSDILEIAANSRFNLGDCYFAQAIPLTDNESQKAIALLRSAITQFRSALRLDRSNADARTNIELAKKLIQQLQKKEQEQQEQKEEQQNSSQPEPNPQDEQNSEEQQNSKDEQNADSDSSNSNKDDSQNQSKQSDSKQSESEQRDTQQEESNSENQNGSQTSQSESDSTQNGSKERDSSSEQSDSSDPGSDPQAEKTDDGESPTDSSNEENKTSQETREGKLTAENSNQAPQSVVSERADPDQKGMMTREEALKLLQAVRDRDMLRRLRQEQKRRSRRVPVDKDW